MNFRKLLAILINYKHNFHIIHWLMQDPNFEEFHELAGDYYTKIEECIDTVAEMGIAQGEMPLTLMEAFDLLKEDKHKFAILKSSGSYSGADLVAHIDVMFGDIVMFLEELIEAVENPGIRSELETMHAWFDKELNYKNKRRKK